MATPGFTYKRIHPDWHMLRIGREAAFFARTRRDVFIKAAAWLESAGRVAA